MRLHVRALTRQAWALADAALRTIVEKNELSQIRPWTEEVAGTVTTHLLEPARIGDDPATSAPDDRHELPGRLGLFDSNGAPASGASILRRPMPHRLNAPPPR
ncbi:hypothetical protein [Streptomyces sp. NPDC047028]|uniref:hypothetical protein n=1 Tax=Streptomyces sp. NPDC047028 TaxID=3155793 RepID=UPI0033E17750